jgi:hypothetical protein
MVFTRLTNERAGLILIRLALSKGDARTSQLLVDAPRVNQVRYGRTIFQ